MAGLQDALKADILAQNKAADGELTVDKGVVSALPPGTKVLSSRLHGDSSWSSTMKLDAEDAEGNRSAYFLKYVAGDLGKRQLEGEFMGMTEMYRLAPDFVPKPIAWGLVRDRKDPTYFLIMTFKDFVPGMPDAGRLGKKLAAMHKQSRSPSGMFGFPVQTFDGARIQVTEWNPSWTSFFGKMLAEAYRQAKERNGEWEALELVHARVQSHLIPRLIGVLESNGREVKPTLIHGDLWEGNIGTEAGTGEPWIFDCAAYYGHNEMELGIWHAQRHRLRDRKYRDQYLANYPASEPEDDCHDRIVLYSTKTNFMYAACFPGAQEWRFAFEDLVYLICKYAPWEENNEDWLKVSAERQGSTEGPLSGKGIASNACAGTGLLSGKAERLDE